MKFEDVAKLIFDEIKPKLEKNQGLYIFAKERAKFEGWLKVELCGSLSKDFPDITPEKNRIDITFDDWAIELKTVNTNYRHENVDVEKKSRPITMNIDGINKDIKKLKSTDYPHKAVLFIVFPAPHNINQDKKWKKHLEKISKLEQMLHEEFKFKDKTTGTEIPGVIYFGLI